MATSDMVLVFWESESLKSDLQGSTPERTVCLCFTEDTGLTYICPGVKLNHIVCLLRDLWRVVRFGLVQTGPRIPERDKI